MLKKSEVFKEGYIKGLKKAQSIIKEMAEQKKYTVSDEFRTGELFDFGDYQIDKLISIKEASEEVINLAKQMLDIWKEIDITKQTEKEIREEYLYNIMYGYYLIGEQLSYLKYKYVDSGLCEEIAEWGRKNGKRNINDILSPVKGKTRL